MRKVELVERVSEQTGMPRQQVLIAVEAAFAEIQNAWLRGENTYVRKFGTFELRKRAAKAVRNITAGTSFTMEEHYIPAFKPAKELKKSINGAIEGKAMIETPAIHDPEKQDMQEDFPF